MGWEFRLVRSITLVCDADRSYILDRSSLKAGFWTTFMLVPSLQFVLPVAAELSFGRGNKENATRSLELHYTMECTHVHIAKFSIGGLGASGLWVV